MKFSAPSSVRGNKKKKKNTIWLANKKTEETKSGFCLMRFISIKTLKSGFQKLIGLIPRHFLDIHVKDKTFKKMKNIFS